MTDTKSCPNCGAAHDPYDDLWAFEYWCPCGWLLSWDVDVEYDADSGEEWAWACDLLWAPP